MVAAPEPQETTTGQAEPEPSVRHLADQLLARAYEFGAYAKYLVSLQIDRCKLTAKRVAVYVILAAAVLAVAGAALLFGTGLLLLGLAGLAGYLVGSFWLGATIVGLLVLILPALAAWIGLRVMKRRAMAALRQKYADIRQKQKATFGRDIREVAHAG